MINLGYKYIWEPEDINKLQELFPIKTNKELVLIFGMSQRTIIRKARELNIYKCDYFRNTIDFVGFAKQGTNHPNAIATRIKKGQHVSPGTEFKKGNVPWIKGKGFYERWKYRQSKKMNNEAQNRQ